MSGRGASGWPANWPKYLPYPQAIPASRLPVPNVQAVNWPQSQFAPLYLCEGSPSFQPYSYTSQDGPLWAKQVRYFVERLSALGPAALFQRQQQTPAGDIARTPNLGGFAVPNPRRPYSQYRRYARQAEAAARQTRNQQIAFYRAAIAQQQARANCEPPVIRMGTMPTNISIRNGVPDPLESIIGTMPDAIATARANGLALQNGIALQNGCDCDSDDCECGMMEKLVHKWSNLGTGAKVGVLAVAAFGGYWAYNRAYAR